VTMKKRTRKIILHAFDASADGATEVCIHSPDTDVLVLAIRRYPLPIPHLSLEEEQIIDQSS
jgi:hypothetical protein